ncbi:ubiquitin carboxyl-terminal hydrolase 25-like [Mangifera indica]|uniref:ubiquitin carboxyl-terminal hydrolase 25-like n=1 Tax=Mangifera indica TaxID=29780 RepID=UPI001CF9EE1A|nr:ubiquitin carboxyl-terminal hydrolase 25-like [Mangifera indica]
MGLQHHNLQMSPLMGLRHHNLQMSWQPSLLSDKRKRGPPLGLRNLGNSCYLNSVLQCLTYTPPLANFCLNLKHSSLCDLARDCPFCILEKRIVRSLSLDLTLDTPAKIQSCLKIFAEHFRGGRQEDAHEFLRYVIDACHNTCLRIEKLKRKGSDREALNGSVGNGTSVVKEIFGGALQSQVKCLSCGAESNKVDEIMDICLDVLHSSSLKDAMQKFFQPEVLDGNNKYKCDNCKKLVAARKQMSILQSPNILVIQLKRFEGMFGGKIDKIIAFEEILILSSFMCKASQDPQAEYKLFGTIVHSGFSPDSGHYYAYIKDAMGRWYCCNDSYVSPSTLQEVLSEKVYILFFSRANQRPESASSTFPLNGVKYGENGNGFHKGAKTAVPLNPVSIKPSAERSSQKSVSTISEVEKVSSTPQLKFNISGNFGCKGVSPTNKGKIDGLKTQNMKINGAVKDSVHKEKFDKDSLMNGNDSNKSRRVDALDKENGVTPASVSENGVTKNIGFTSVKLDHNEGNVMRNGITPSRGSDHTKPLNGSINGHSVSGSKRKLLECCILFAQDPQSQAKVQELREFLEKEASFVLRSCGWSENVYSFMSSRKRLCAQEAGNAPSGAGLKKLLITDAKRTFISQIPEPLKEDLIKRLWLFGKEKQESPGS